MPLLETRALKRIPLTAAIVAAVLAIWGASVAQSANADRAPDRTVIALLHDSARTNAPPPRALGFTVEYFRSLGIDVREAREEPEAPAKPAPHECDPSEDNRLARRPAAPAAPNHNDSSHLMTARAQATPPAARRTAPHIEARTG